MLGSLDLGHLFGIRIRVSWTFVILAAVLLMTGAARDAVTLATFGMLLVSVLLHELGHALVAQSLGIQVLDITFWPLGGMARMSEIPENPRLEAVIAGAGPMVNFLLAALALPLMLLGGLFSPNTQALVSQLVFWFVAINLSLGLFNLLPAFPMDGGRILRAFLANRFSWPVATAMAVRVGRWLALGMVIFGLLFWRGGWAVMPLIALFIWFAGASELTQVRLRHGLNPLNGKPIFPGGAGAGFASAGFGGADPFADLFGRRPAPEAEPAETLGTESPGHDQDRPEPEADPDGPRRPGQWVADVDSLGRDGFSEDELRQLERYRGRLRPDES